MKDIKFIEVNEEIKKEWMNYSGWSKEINEEVIRISNGWSIIAEKDGEMMGIISVYYKNLLEPLKDTIEAYIDSIEVREKFRNMGVATLLIEEALNRVSKIDSLYQIRAWSSEDKIAMINLWKKLGFTLCPVVQHYETKKVSGYYVSKVLKK